MSISQSDNSYKSDSKKEWREFLYSLATPDTTSRLTDENGKYNHKWLEPVGDNAVTFTQLLSTKKIDEHQLIGIDIRPKNIDSCKTLFPNASFYCGEWNNFCESYEENDIGIIILDLFMAGKGGNFDKTMKYTIGLAERCQEKLGECLIVINIDGTKTYMKYGFQQNKSAKEVFKTSLEEMFRKYGHDIPINMDSIYSYRQDEKTSEMLSCVILLDDV